MSRRSRTEEGDNESGVRLFAFSNLASGYQVVFTPPQPIVILRTKRSLTPQHPCAQWKPLAEMIFERSPHEHAVYVADTTQLDSKLDDEENVTGSGLGPVLRSFSKMFHRLHPAGASIVGAGVSALWVLKYALFLPTINFGMISQILLLCPPSVDGAAQLIRQASKHNQQRLKGELRPKLYSLHRSEEEAAEWRIVLADLAEYFLEVNCEVLKEGEPLFDHISLILRPIESTTTLDFAKRIANPKTFQIHFTLDRFTKQIEQEVSLSPLDCALPNATCTQQVQNETEAPRQEAKKCYDTMDVLNAKGGTTIIVGRILEGGRIGNAHGIIQLSGVPKEIDFGKCVRCEADICRNREGCTSLAVKGTVSIIESENEDDDTLVCHTDDIPPTNVSAVKQSYGCVLIRGRKCVLVRSLSKVWLGLRLPYLAHSDANETPLECAVRAVCTLCDITPDNFYVHQFIAPVNFFPNDHEVVTLFAAFAVCPPPGGVVSDTVEDAEDLDDLYDWMSMSQAQTKLSNCEEKAALIEIGKLVEKAKVAGFYSPPWGLGLFGEDLRDSHAHIRSSFTLVFVHAPCFRVDLLRCSVLNAADSLHIPKDRIVFDCSWNLCSIRERIRALNPEGDIYFIVPSHIDANADTQQVIPPLLAEMGFGYRWVSWFEDTLVTTKIFAEPFSELTLLALDPSFDPERNLLRHCLNSVDRSDAIVAFSPKGPIVPSVLRKIVRNNIPIFPSFEAMSGHNQFAFELCASDVLHFDYFRQLPFLPEALHELCLEGAFAQHFEFAGVIVCRGQCWLSTRPLQRGNIVQNGRSLEVEEGDAWECCFDDNTDEDRALWHKDFGDRSQHIEFLCIAPSSEHIMIQKRVEALFDARLCSENDAMRWQEHRDPFSPWKDE